MPGSDCACTPDDMSTGAARGRGLLATLSGMRAGAVVGLGLCLALFGCSSSAAKPAPRAAPTPGISSSPSLRALPRPSSSLSPSGAAAPRAVPTQARKGDAFGAAAFVHFFFESLNRAYQSASPNFVSELSDPACRTCANYVRSVADLRAAKHRVLGNLFVVISAEAAPPAEGVDLVDSFVALPSTTEIYVAGQVIHVSKADPKHHYNVVLLRRGNDWKVRALQDRS